MQFEPARSKINKLMVNVSKDLKCFNGDIDKENRFRRFGEYEKLILYLQYLKEKVEYEII